MTDTGRHSSEAFWTRLHTYRSRTSGYLKEVAEKNPFRYDCWKYDEINLELAMADLTEDFRDRTVIALERWDARTRAAVRRLLSVETIAEHQRSPRGHH